MERTLWKILDFSECKRALVSVRSVFVEALLICIRVPPNTLGNFSQCFMEDLKRHEDERHDECLNT
jgi:hypothetical protein